MAEVGEGSQGNIMVTFRFPDGTTKRGRFWEGAARDALFAFALDSDWGKSQRQPRVSLFMGFPPESVSQEGVITSSFNRTLLIVRVSDGRARPDSAPPPMQAEGQLRAEPAPPDSQLGIQPQTAAAPPSGLHEPSVSTEPLASPAAHATGGGGGSSQEESIEQVMTVTVASRASALAALQESRWNVDAAVNRIFDAQSATREALRVPPSAVTTHRSRRLLPGLLQTRRTSAVGAGGRNPSDVIKDCGLGAIIGCVLACAVAVCTSMQ